MLEIATIRSQFGLAVQGLSKRGIKEAEALLNQVLALDKSRRETQIELDSTLAEANNKAREIGRLIQTGAKDQAESAKQETAGLKAKARSLQQKLVDLVDQQQQALYNIPNIPNSDVPNGSTANDNLVVAEWGEKPALHAQAKPHWDLIKQYDIIDFELGNKVSGAGFPFYKGKGAKLVRALANYCLDQADAAGYLEIQPPVIVNQESGTATGQLPDKEGQMYAISDSEQYLIPTAEVPITNIYRDVLLHTKDLPIKNVGFTPCFRREAGSWGSDVRGLNRLHQFDKVEIVQVNHPEHSYQALKEMVEHVAGLLQQLKLPYRIVNLCGGDLGFTAAQTFDFEVYSAGQDKWLEVSSVSNFETYQANRLKLRCRGEDKKNFLLHTLNGSALAIPRVLAAILENNQLETGIKIPDVLVQYAGFDTISL
ncbi:MAG: serine--tRNA ligase [Cyclobacteriaceae bacterium]|nr:MAG: serine--tRNA ligase [Cyclobacteriaceae bacterium]